MFGIGMPEMLLILAIALIVIGPKKLPDLAKSLGKALGEFKKATSELKESIDLDSDLKQVRESFDDIRGEAQGTGRRHTAEAEKTSPAGEANPSDSGAPEPTSGKRPETETPESSRPQRDDKTDREGSPNHG